jgi:hypothetical protein
MRGGLYRLRIGWRKRRVSSEDLDVNSEIIDALEQKGDLIERCNDARGREVELAMSMTIDMVDR